MKAKTFLLPFAVTPFIFFASCEEKTPAEEAADGIEDAAEEVGDAVEDATD